MCSNYASLDENSISSANARFFYNSTFTADALQQRMKGPDHGCLGPKLTPEESSAFLDYLYDGFLQRARVQGHCGSCWAYAISAAVQSATALAYQRLGGWFNNRYMAPQLLLSCVEQEGVACGCFGGDLAAMMALVSKEGIVTFRQFPYENDSSVVTNEGQVHYICRPNEGPKGYLGTCAPCRVDEADFEEVVPSVVGPVKDTTAFVTLSSCMPCDSIGAPFYFPFSPCRLYREEESIEANVDVVKRALRTHGPLCATVKVNREDMKQVGKSQLITGLQEAPVYRPQSTPASGALHSITIVGYYDPWAVGKKTEDRRRAVFVCRNSWGPDWGFKVKTRRIEQQTDGSQIVVDVVLGGFFAVSMYEFFEEIGLVQTAIAIKGMQIRTLGDAVPGPLRLTDPFVVPFKPGFLEAFHAKGLVPKLTAAVEATGSSSETIKAPPRSFKALTLVSALVIATLLIVLVIIFYLG
jgi:hypothetical protein